MDDTGWRSADAYGRVTNPERFAVLHGYADRLLERLAREFDVDRTESHGDTELAAVPLVRPIVALVPRERTAAPVAVAFTAFPGLRVRAGRWCVMSFPECGCDACDETPEQETARFRLTIQNVVEARFREAVLRLPGDDIVIEWEFWSDAGRSRQRFQPSSDVRARLGTVGRPAQAWKRWPRRPGRAGEETM